MTALKHYPVTLSSKPSPQAKQMLPVGSQSLQLLGHAALKVRRIRREANAFMFDVFFIIKVSSVGKYNTTPDEMNPLIIKSSRYQ